MMVDKIASSAAKMQNDAIEDKTLPIVAVIDKFEKYKVHVRTAPSKDVSDGINDLLSGDFLGRQKSLIGVALNKFLDNGSGGETDHTHPPPRSPSGARLYDVLVLREVTQQFFIRGGSALKSNPLPFYIPYFTKKVPPSYAFNGTPFIYLV